MVDAYAMLMLMLSVAVADVNVVNADNASKVA